jgi:hypothetical protein
MYIVYPSSSSLSFA